MVCAISIALAIAFTVGCQSKPKVTDAKPDAQTNNPKLTKPSVRRSWIPQRIEDDGKVMEEGHWRYEVLGGSSWSR